MKFGAVPLEEAEGAILAHSHPVAAGRLRKGSQLTRDDLAALAEAGHRDVVVARPEPGDVPEDQAAACLGAALVTDAAAQGLSLTAPVNGRVNLMATGPGILDFDPDAILALNLVDPMITFATLPRYARIGLRSMVGTVKIIPYAVPQVALTAAADAARAAGIRLRGPVWTEATLIETTLGSDGPEKGEAAIRQRLEGLGARLTQVQSVPHETGALAGAIRQAQGLVLVLTASATSDLLDTAPQAVRQAGGSITRFGMPVDPGNLLFLGEQAGRPVIGLPGCARSPALNGADLVLNRIICGLPLTDRDIAAMGVGGLLKETRHRGQPRSG